MEEKKWWVLETKEKAIFGENRDDLLKQAKENGFRFGEDDFVSFKTEDEAKEKVKKYNEKKKQEKEDKQEKLRKIMYNRVEDKNGKIKYEGFIGEALEGVCAKFRDLDGSSDFKNEDNAIGLASITIERLSASNNKKHEFPYEDKDADNFYNVKYAFAYSQHFNYVYRNLLKKIDKKVIRKGKKLTIVSIGAGNLVDYWSLESALYMENWDDDAVQNIYYRAYEYNEWKETMEDVIIQRDMDSPFRIPVDHVTLNIGKLKGDFFNISNKVEVEEEEEVVVVVFPSSFNELLEQQKLHSLTEHLEKLKPQTEPQYFIITGISETEAGEIKNEIKELVGKVEDNQIEIASDETNLVQSYKNILYTIKNDEKKKNWVKQNGLTIASIGTDAIEIYASLETALAKLEWEEDVEKFQFIFYFDMDKDKIDKVKINNDKKNEIQRNIPERKIDREKLHFENYNDIITSQRKKKEARLKTDIVVFPNTFKKLIEEQKKYFISDCLINMDPDYIITTGHISDDDNDIIEKEIEKLKEKKENWEINKFDNKELTTELIKESWISVMREDCIDEFTDKEGRLKDIMGILDEKYEDTLLKEAKKQITHYKPLKKKAKMKQEIYKINKSDKSCDTKKED